MKTTIDFHHFISVDDFSADSCIAFQTMIICAQPISISWILTVFPETVTFVQKNSLGATCFKFRVVGKS